MTKTKCLLLAVAAAAMALTFSCTSDIETAEEFLSKLSSSSEGSSSPSDFVSCRLPNGECSEITLDVCNSSNGMPVQSCVAASSSSTPLSSSVAASSSSAVLISSSVVQSSSSAVPSGTAFCKLPDGTCSLSQVSAENCNAFGGTLDPACAPSSSSSVPSSSSAPPSSSSSSSISSSSSSSSSVAPSSSSAIDNETPQLWDLSMGMVIQTSGGWFNYYDKYDQKNGKSVALMYDKTSESYLTYDILGVYPNSVDNMDWSGEVSYSLDPSGFEYAYGGVGFVWIDGTPVPEVWGSHTGLCVEYSLSGNGDYYLLINTDGYTEYNEFKAAIPKQETVGKKFFDFSRDFTQEQGWGYTTTLSNAKARSTGMAFEGRAPATKYSRVQEGTLVIKSVSWGVCQ